MVTEFDARNNAWLKSKHDSDEVVVVYQDDDGNYGYCLEWLFMGEESQIRERYLNGSLVPA